MTEVKLDYKDFNSLIKATTAYAVLWVNAKQEIIKRKDFSTFKEAIRATQRPRKPHDRQNELVIVRGAFNDAFSERYPLFRVGFVLPLSLVTEYTKVAKQPSEVEPTNEKVKGGFSVPEGHEAVFAAADSFESEV